MKHWGRTGPALETGEGESGETAPEKGQKKKRTIHWDIEHVLTLSGVFLAYLYHFETLDRQSFLIILSLTVGVGIATAVVWRLTAKYTVEAFKSVFHHLKGKSDSLCLVKSKQSATHSLLDHLYMAVEWCFFPTLVVFFVLSYIADIITPSGEAVVRTEGGNYWLIYIFMFIIPPLVTFIVIPIRLIMDSSLMRYDIQRRTLEPFGLTFKRMFRAVGGVGALASFANVALKKGGVVSAFTDTFTILLYVFPTIFIAVLFYGYWHPRYLREIEEKVRMYGYQMYIFDRTEDGAIALLPVIEDMENSELTLSYRLNKEGQRIPVLSERKPAWSTPVKDTGGAQMNEEGGVPEENIALPVPPAEENRESPETEREEEPDKDYGEYEGTEEDYTEENEGETVDYHRKGYSEEYEERDEGDEEEDYGVGEEDEEENDYREGRDVGESERDEEEEEEDYGVSEEEGEENDYRDDRDVGESERDEGDEEEDYGVGEEEGEEKDYRADRDGDESERDEGDEEEDYGVGEEDEEGYRESDEGEYPEEE